MRTGFSERQLRRHATRHEAVHARLGHAGARSVLDLGCGDGQLIERLARDSRFTRLTGVDIDEASLQIADTYTKPLVAGRPDLSVTYRLGSMLTLDGTIPSHDAVTVVEVIEHLPAPELSALEEVVFRELHPDTIIITTPAADPDDQKHAYAHEHQFEWTPAEAVEWADRVSASHGYSVAHNIISTHPLSGLDIQILGFKLN